MRVFNELVPAGAQEAAAGPAATTGRYLVLLEEGAGPEVLAQSDLHVLSTADFEGGILSAEAVSEADAVVFPNIGVALVDAPPENLAGARAAAAPGSAILAVEPERVCEAIELRDDVPIRLEAEQALSLDYLR